MNQIGSIEYSIEYWKKVLKLYSKEPDSIRKDSIRKEVKKILDSYIKEQNRRKKVIGIQEVDENGT